MSKDNKDNERIVFDAICGNPPYQVTKGGTKNVNVWQHFVKVANLCGAKYISMIHPGRWVVPKSQMEDVRDEILSSGLEKFDFYDNASLLFPDTNIAGGVTITNFKKDYKDKIEYFVDGKSHGEYTKDILFTSNPFEEEIVEKFVNKVDLSKTLEDRKLGDMSFESCFGYFKKKDIKKLKKSDKGMKSPVHFYTNGSFASGGASRKDWYYIEKDVFTELPKGILNKRKVMISKNGDLAGGYRQNPEIIGKNDLALSYLFIPDNDTDYELKLIQSMLATKTIRYILSLKMKDQCVRGFENIPDYTYFMDDMKDPKYNNKMFENKLGLLTDEYFYKKFNFNQELIDYIEKTLNTKELV